ncbi:YjbH domain-containing protein [Pseudooceanicola lipolyticus]|uniref:YjbH domain-containing protein n=1 Tax=Pseudooceanicola lipolyticus TaxID=2029104 RepID=A0A2M8J053_9RHOB|nr:YjbH domain-containing protein [Pseudooceanicola lipolyticus]PJE36149.1 YjbH domain-containing protein [Pseudooceanicola lipolyticus]
MGSKLGFVTRDLKASRALRRGCILALFCLGGGAILAQERASLSFYGTPGLIDMPTADSMRDGDVSLSAGRSPGTWRTVFHFQVTPRISGVFRYGKLENYTSTGGTLYDRSFDFHFRLVDETLYRPAIAVGLRDFGGTGVYSGEYVVATKGVGERLRLTGGIGWGRLGSYNSFSNPLGVVADGFNNRNDDGNNTGELDTGAWFRGDAALFAGLQWNYSDHLVLKAEYSSDAYDVEVARTGFEHKLPINLGATYRFDNGIDLSAAYRYGSELALMFHYTFNPAEPRIPDGINGGGPAVMPRNLVAARSWDLEPEAGADDRLRVAVARTLAEDGLSVKALSISGTTATIHVRNDRYDAPPQAIGRTARAMSEVLPAQIETFVIVPINRGVPVSAVTIRRSDLEELAFDLDGSWKSYSRAAVMEGSSYRLRPENYVPEAYPEFEAGVGGYFVPSFFDPDSPVRAEVGIEAFAAFTPTPGLIFSGALRQPIAGNIDKATRRSNSVLPHVRSDAVEYAKESELELSYLTGEYFFRPGENLYGRVSVGYLERMYGGVSAELLWKPVEGPLALGGEINYVRQRDYDILFDFRDYEIATGHLSAYYDLGAGYLGQVDAGRYLAGDWGATFSLDREFANGFRIGGFFTLTDVSSQEFGEGAFDKGIRFSMPLSWLTGEPAQRGFGLTLRPVTRDGGARLNVRNRLYEVTRGYHDPELRERWGRFWR